MNQNYYTPVYFVNNEEKLETNSNYIRGFQIYQSLARLHKNTHWVNIQKLLAILKNTREQRTIIYTCKPSIKTIDTIRKHSNIYIIYDIIDDARNGMKKVINITQKSDIIIVPNSDMLKILNTKYPNKVCYTEFHNWDSKFASFTRTIPLNKPIFSMSGHLNEFEKLILTKLKDKIVYLGICPLEKELQSVNIALCFRNDEEMFVKPTTKLSASASFQTIYAGTGNYTFKEMLGSNYPYLISNENIDINRVKKFLTYIESTYNTDVWFEAQKIMKEVLHKTSVDSITKRLYDVLDKHLCLQSEEL